jgi:hypothetical protein
MAEVTRTLQENFLAAAVLDHGTRALCLSQESLCRRADSGDADAGGSSRRNRQVNAIFAFKASGQRAGLRRTDREKALTQR